MRVPLVAIALLALPLTRAQSQQRPTRADSIEQGYLAAIPRAPWPGFHPESIPLAIYDGNSTTIYRHPAAPADFKDGASRRGGVSMPGRHPAVTANTSVELGGRTIATVMAPAPTVAADARRSPPRAGAAGAVDAPAIADFAAVALHEAFHVFQRTQHQGWAGNEADLFTYPVSDASRLALRRLESETLRRALAARSTTEAACWARTFIATRAERFNRLDAAFPRYERLTELNEGLANYIQLRAAGRSTVEFPKNEFAPAAVRIRTYTVGPAIAFLLDRLSPHWQDSLETHDSNTLDALLDASLKRGAPPAKRCELTSVERDSARRIAQADSSALAAGRTTRRAAFDARTGTRLIVQSADGAPLWPQGFDPLDVELIDGGLLSTRFIKLGNDAATVELIDEGSADIDALTVGAGAHPLFNGVRRLEAVGFGAPDVQQNGSSVTITASGLKLTAKNATLEREGDRLIVILARKP